MSKHGTIRRYTLIIEKINRGQYPSFEIIKDHLFEHGFEISARTIQRDIEQIRFEFGIEIVYDRLKNGYFIDLENSLNIESFFRFLEIVNTAELLSESLAESKDSLKYISFDNIGNLQGIQNLKSLLHAIKQKREISFNHTNFHSGNTKNYILKPYLLKEYLNRWYVVGKIRDQKEFRTFGIDRITELEVRDKNFTHQSGINPAELFENIIGVVYSLDTQQKVVLSYTPTQGKYIKTLPLHKSQKIISENEKELIIELDIIPNYELTQKILMHGDTVKVVEPKWLAEEIKEILKNTLKKYKIIKE
jgi:predicted DNA-binding transcriptional regulator YafY